MRKVAERILAGVIAWPILRLSLGRVPDASEIRRFCRGFCGRPASMPALLRGLGSLPTIQKHFKDCLSPEVSAVKPVAFLHIEKTAGTSVLKYLERQYNPTRVDPDPFHGAPGHLLSPLPADKRGYDLIWGHHDLPALQRCQPPERLILSFFREPGSRILSLYAFWRALKPGQLELREPHIGIVAARTRTLLEFLDSKEAEVQDFIDNVYLRRLTGLYASHKGANQASCALDIVQRKAETAFAQIDCVGLVEEMGLSLQMVAARISGAPPSIVFHENALDTLVLEPSGSHERMVRRPVTSRERMRLEELTNFDKELYQMAKARFELQRLWLS